MAEDESYLNKRGLTHFWENIDDLKQDKLTAGTNISINNNTISSSQPAATTSSLGVVQVGSGLAISSGGVLSATGGGTADAVAWGHITGTMADQTDLKNALDAKVDSSSLATVATSGSYNDLSNKPTIPTVNNATLTIQKNSTTIDTFTANASQNKTVNITVPVTAADVSALPASTKYAASLTASINTTTYVMTLTLKDQDGNTLGTAQTIDLPLESVVVNGSYDSTNKKIVLTLQSGSTIDIPVGDLISGLQSEITSSNMLDADLVDDSTSTHKFTTASDISKLAGIAAGAEVNVQSDWNQTTNTADDYIKNKPSLAAVATSGAYSDLSGTPSLATVATSGSYNDLSNKPTIPAAQVNSDWNSTSGVSKILNKPTLATVATSGSYNDLSNKPTIPTVNNATLTIQKNGTNVQTFTANQGTNATANITVPTKTSDLTNDSGFLDSVAWGDVTGKPTFATVATSGSYNDLSNKPTIPTVNNATLTIQKNGTDVQTFTANQSTNATANITVPTNNNELTNGAGYITSSGTAAKANQLTTARTIAIGTGATGTATSFNGTSNITIPITDVKDAYVSWGGKNIVQNVTPDDMGCIDEFGHNKLAYLPASCLDVAYSIDGGTTWVDYGVSDANKVKAVTTTGPGFYVGGPDDNATAENIANLKLRVRLAAGPTTGGKVYTAAKKILINMSTQGAGGCKVDIRYRTIANYKSGTDTWVTVGTYDVGGGSGWNSIPFNYTFGGNFTTQTSQMGQIEFVLYCSSLGSWGRKKPDLIDFRMIGGTNWTMPSEMARAGHLYTVDENQNATFPANVKVTGSLQHGSYSYTLPNKNGTVAMTSDLPTVNNATLTIQKNGTDVQTFTANQSTNATANITVPTKTSDLSNDSGFLTSIPTASASTLGGIKVGSGLSISNGVLSTQSTAPDWSDITNKPTFATVATSGSYNDLSNKPTIPTVNNATLTIQKNGTTVNTFTANASSNVTANISVPTTVAELSDSTDYATVQSLNGKQDELTAGNHIDITNDVISATDYVHSENPVSTTAVTPIVTGSMISNGTITADKLATGATVQLTLSTTDIGEGAALATNTLYGVYQ